MIIEFTPVSERAKYSGHSGVYERWFEARGGAILSDAGVGLTLSNLEEEIRGEHKDVRRRDRIATFSHGIVSEGIAWGFQGPEADSAHNELLLMARIATGEIIIPTNQGDIVLAPSQLRVEGALRAAMDQAYHNPIRAGLFR